MAKNWTMKATTHPEENCIDFQIIDNHHVNSFYGEWTAHDMEEFNYHFEGVRDCISRGTYANSEYMIDGERVNSLQEFQDKMCSFIETTEKKKAA